MARFCLSILAILAATASLSSQGRAQASVHITSAEFAVNGAALTAQELRIVDQNIHRDPSALASAIAKAKAKAESAQVILLQEVCKSHLDDSIGDSGIKEGWSVSFQQDQTNCPGIENGGDAAIWTGGTSGVAVSMTFSDQAPLEQDPDVNDAYDSTANGMACILFQSEYRACSVHLAVGPAQLQLNQVTEIEDWMQRPSAGRYWISSGKRIILGGDFNMTPDRAAMDQVYKNPTSTSQGYFHEATRLQQPAGSVNVCRCGVDTTSTTDTDKKIDYVFVSSNVFSNAAISSLATSVNSSDHKMLYARAAINY